MSLRARPALLGSIPITKNAVLFQISAAMLGDSHVTPGTSCSARIYSYNQECCLISDKRGYAGRQPCHSGHVLLC